MKMLFVLLVITFAPLGGCTALDDLVAGKSWFTTQPQAARYTEPEIMSPLAGDEIASSDETFSSSDYSLTLGTVLPPEQMDMHRANLLSLITNTVNKGSSSPWEGSIELGQQLPDASVWMASLDTKYEPDISFDADPDYVPMSALAMAWIDNEDEPPIVNDPLVAEIAQDPLGMSAGLLTSSPSSNLALGEIVSTSLRWIAMVFLAIVLLIPIGCSYTAKLIGKRARPSRKRRRADDRVLA